MIFGPWKAWLRRLWNAPSGAPDDFLGRVSGVVHVGANLGQEREIYSGHGLRVIWIEPIPEIYSRLSANIRRFRNQIAYQALVTDVDDREYDFHIASNNGGSSSIFDLKRHLELWPEVGYTKSVRLRSTTLPTLFAKERIDARRYDALIMDTQGSELLVLRGSLPILRRFKFIKTEVPDFESYAGCCQLPAIEDFMHEHGYEEFSRRRFAGRAGVGNYFDIVYRRK